MRFHFTELIIVLLSLTSISVSAHTDSPSIENACMDAAQGKVAWDYQGSKRWAEKNLQALCNGTQRAKEPIRCFHTAMHRNVSWGGSTRWDWKNALKLCAGTSNGNATIYCFKGAINSGQSWKRAIETCHTPKLTANSHTQTVPVSESEVAASSTINSEGNVVVSYPDGTVREYFDGGIRVTQPNGESQTSLFSTQAPAAIPPAVPDQIHQDWLEMHSNSLLNILSNLVNNDQTAIDNYLAYEGSDASLYESIQLRSKTIDLLLP
ncbi:MAG: hypothetical protein KTR35_21585 [Gammaproteobacteria bacterium]|nr:hypothetical protein [Gammaproteobacteria bacterium]